jgi:hypothetical protein
LRQNRIVRNASHSRANALAADKMLPQQAEKSDCCARFDSIHLMFADLVDSTTASNLPKTLTLKSND